MTFQIKALDYGQFEELFGMTDEELKSRAAVRVVAASSPGYPCRVSLEDAEPGETLILLNYRHLEASSPYAASHAIFVREGAKRAEPVPGEVPDVLSRRLLSLRAFDASGFMIGADVVDGSELKINLERLFEKAEVEFVDIHNAKPGCFAARSFRAPAVAH